jgi:hypothetical protein
MKIDFKLIMVSREFSSCHGSVMNVLYNQIYDTIRTS